MGVINLGPIGRKFNVSKDVIFPNDWVKEIDYNYIEDNGKWEIALLKSTSISQILTFNHRLKTGIKVFLVAGGKSGSIGSFSADASNRYAYGGNGGNGGEIINFTIDKINYKTDFVFQVGGSDTNSIFDSYTAITGNGSTGGVGGGVRDSGNIRDTGDGVNGQGYAFGAENISLFNNYKTILFGPGGGGGGAVAYYVGYDYPEGGYTFRPDNGSRQGIGGIFGGGNGGTACSGYSISFSAAKNGQKNTGGGGGGGATVGHYNYGTGDAGTGGSGIILIQGLIE